MLWLYLTAYAMTRNKEHINFRGNQHSQYIFPCPKQLFLEETINSCRKRSYNDLGENTSQSQFLQLVMEFEKTGTFLFPPAVHASQYLAPVLQKKISLSFDSETLSCNLTDVRCKTLALLTCLILQLGDFYKRQLLQKECNNPYCRLSLAQPIMPWIQPWLSYSPITMASCLPQLWQPVRLNIGLKDLLGWGWVAMLSKHFS